MIKYFTREGLKFQLKFLFHDSKQKNKILRKNFKSQNTNNYHRMRRLIEAGKLNLIDIVCRLQPYRKKSNKSSETKESAINLEFTGI